jgi:hypothetical protein
MQNQMQLLLELLQYEIDLHFEDARMQYLLESV